MTIIKDLVSTIIPVFNRASMLCRAVNSVLAQTYRPIEIIIVDDGSNDGTEKVVNDLQSEHPEEIIVIHQINSGPGSAREAGRKIARGEFIQYLDSDDILLPNKFELQVIGLRKHPECGISYGKTRHYTLPSDMPCKQTGEKLDYMFPVFLKNRIWHTATPLYRREVTDKAGPWTNLWQEEDWEYDCRIASQGVKLHYCEQFIAEISTDGKSTLCGRWHIEPDLMRQRVNARELIYQHALKAGIEENTFEMQHFSRELFLFARLCGNMNLKKESLRMFHLSRVAAGKERAKGWDYRLYWIFANILGWFLTGKLTCLIDRFRK